jgi:hypothetical protein
MEFIYKVFNWVFGGLFMLIGGLLLNESSLGGAFIITLAATLLPPVRRFIYSKTNKELPRALSIVILFTAFFVLSGQIADKEEEKLLAQQVQNKVDHFNDNRETIILSIKTAFEKNNYQSVVSQSNEYLIAKDNELDELNLKAKTELERISNNRKEEKRKAKIKARTEEILAKLKLIPASEYEKNRVLYQELVTNNPDTNKYNKKLSYYSTKVREQRENITKSGKIQTAKFNENDFIFDGITRPYKSLIIAGVNKVHRENSNCKKIDPSSAYKSMNKGSKSNPVFFVTCGESGKSFNVYFSKSDVENNKQIIAKKHINKSLATDICESYAKSNAAHPSTVRFSRIMDLAAYETPNGRTRITSSFTAKNSFNLELKYKISCLLNRSGLIDASINEAL